MVDQEKIKILDYKTPGSFEETRYEKLHSVILDSSAEGSVVIANYIANLILEKQGKNEKCVLGLATGSSPLSIYKELIRMHKENGLSFKDIDYIVSKDTFEHSLHLDKILEKFHQILKKDGRIFVGFGPLYNFYNGDHGRAEAILPWFHIIIPEKILINRLNKKYKKNLKKIEDLGLSKYSFKDYIRLFRDSKFEITYFKTNFSDHPISVIFNLLSKIKILEEYFTYNIYSILKK